MSTLLVGELEQRKCVSQLALRRRRLLDLHSSMIASAIRIIRTWW
jgi:hypothetical protein